MTKTKPERASCTVRALSASTQISYELAGCIASEAGRVAGRRFKSSALIDAAKRKGIRFKKLRFTGKTVRKFIEANPEGRFYARKNGHAFAIIDGQVSDATRAGTIIVDVWQHL